MQRSSNTKKSCWNWRQTIRRSDVTTESPGKTPSRVATDAPQYIGYYATVSGHFGAPPTYCAHELTRYSNATKGLEQLSSHPSKRLKYLMLQGILLKNSDSPSAASRVKIACNFTFCSVLRRCDRIVLLHLILIFPHKKKSTPDNAFASREVANLLL